MTATPQPRTWATERLDQLVSGPATILPPVIQTLRLVALDEWGVGWIRELIAEASAQQVLQPREDVPEPR